MFNSDSNNKTYNEYEELLKQNQLNQNLNLDSNTFNNFTIQSFPQNLNLDNNNQNHHSLPIFFNSNININPYQNTFLINKNLNNNSLFINNFRNNIFIPYTIYGNISFYNNSNDIISNNQNYFIQNEKIQNLKSNL